MAESTDKQLRLELTVGDGTAPYSSDRSVFPESYLRRQLRNPRFLPSADEVRPLYGRLRTLWEENWVGLRRRKEAYTRSQFLDVLLRELGWRFIPEESLPATAPGLRKRPDYCLFADDAALQEAAAQQSTAEVFRRAATVLEAKKAGHPLDQVSTTETPGWFPSQQAMDYLRNSRDATGRRFFNWVILTNAEEWRLYGEHTAAGAFFSLRLARGEFFCDIETFRLFVALFRAAAFDQDAAGKCLLDRVREEALLHQVEIETNLRRRVFGVLEDLALAFYRHPANGLTDADLPRLYDVSLIYLYRLLFVLYAESRNLLPVRPTGLGASKRYRDQFSLARFVDRLRDRGAYDSEAFDELGEALLKLFHLIHGNRPEQNAACGVTRYNGGLFNPNSHPEVEKWRIGDRALANVLRQLVFAQPPAREKARQLLISTDETIDYATLEVRQLGDIYEGLLGARLVPEGDRLTLKDENGKNHRAGVFYTPDWVVEWLNREALEPLLDTIEASAEVQNGLAAKSDEKRKDNSFALAVLRMNLVDPAMGSGHFLVRAVEWLSERIVYHPTTRRMTEQIVATGERRRARAEIEADGRIAVSGGCSQEEAEVAYWRRRVVEACIHGVDVNPLAVELAKLALWLTCIAPDEPLSFLDHHLRQGNSLLYARARELRKLPGAADASSFEIGGRLTAALRDVIAATVDIEATASTEMDLVKQKEKRWRDVTARLRPFVETADDWAAALAGVSLDPYSYRTLAALRLAPESLAHRERRDAEGLAAELAARRDPVTQNATPFHWELAFPDVFFRPDGTPMPDEAAGFDAVLGNPPYVSTHTSAGGVGREALAGRFGYTEDLYVHFTDLAFRLLRTGGTLGYIVSDTFFTLASKLPMRNMLQANTLLRLGQCDPFDATVDAALLVARKAPPPPDHRLLFVQARPRRLSDGTMTRPDEALPALPPLSKLELADRADGTRHGAFDCLRLHVVPAAIYSEAHKQAFFEPRPGTLVLFSRFNEPVKRLVDAWWPRIETSAKFADNREAISEYQASLQPGDVTLVGLIAEGGQGLRTANNARFLGYLDGTPQAELIRGKRETWTQRWLQSEAIAAVFRELVGKAGGNPAKPLADSAAWEAAVEALRERFGAGDLGFGKTDLYRIVPPALVATEEDFQFAWETRRDELFAAWGKEPKLAPFWEQPALPGISRAPCELRKARKIGDADSCALCQELQKWLAANRLSVRFLGLRSGEDYRDPADAPRIATIYNGFRGRRRFAPFRKGDPEGNRWLDNEPLYIDWLAPAVEWLFANSGKSETRMPVIRNANLYFTPGITWTAVANHVAVKARFQEPCVFDADSMRLTPLPGTIAPRAFLALLNSDFFSHFKMRFIKHTQKWEIGDLRQVPLVMPTEAQAKRLQRLAEIAVETKRLQFAGNEPGNDLAAEVRDIADELLAAAPPYLRPGAQMQFLATVADCLATVELAVNWEAEKLYGVEGLGPFDDF
jgi:hypothetical protein